MLSCYQTKTLGSEQRLYRELQHLHCLQQNLKSFSLKNWNQMHGWNHYWKLHQNLGLNFASEGYVCIVPTIMAQIYELRFQNILGVVSQVGLSFLSFGIKSWVYNNGFKNWNREELPPKIISFQLGVYDVLSHFPATSSAQKFHISMHVHTYPCTDMWWIPLRIFPPSDSGITQQTEVFSTR